MYWKCARQRLPEGQCIRLEENEREFEDRHPRCASGTSNSSRHCNGEKAKLYIRCAMLARTAKITNLAMTVYCEAIRGGEENNFGACAINSASKIASLQLQSYLHHSQCTFAWLRVHANGRISYSMQYSAKMANDNSRESDLNDQATIKTAQLMVEA